MNEELEILQKKLNYEFKDKSLLTQALIHRSYSNEHPGYKDRHNERLEFLGDAVLELVFSDLLFKKYRKLPEGRLTRYRSAMVCEPSFARLADYFTISDKLIMGKGEMLTGGSKKKSLKADAFEAVCGAIYLDGGIEPVFALVESIFDSMAEEVESHHIQFIDYKSRLQEYLHSKKTTNISYQLDRMEGMAHDRTFYMTLYVAEKKLATGRGKSKKAAEQEAARMVLEKLGVDYE